MKAQTKQAKIESVVADLQKASAIYLINYQGIVVAKDNALRKTLRKKGIVYRAVKNTLLQRALAEVGVTGLDKYLVGATAVMLGSSEDPMLPAKEMVEFLKANPDAIKMKGVSLEGDVLENVKLDDVAKMPGRLDLIAQVVSMAIGPGAKLVALIKGPGSKIAGAVKALEEKLEKSAG